MFDFVPISEQKDIYSNNCMGLFRYRNKIDAVTEIKITEYRGHDNGIQFGN